MQVGIELLNAYVGAATIDVARIFEGRSLNAKRAENLMMNQKSVALPCEDPVTLAVNAAKPIVDRLSEVDKNRIEMVVTASESGLDFGKSLSTYVHHHLGLSRRCKVFEVKQACFGGTVGLGIAANHVVANPTGDPKVLVIATDVARPPHAASYAEPAQGAGAVAFLVSAEPKVFELDFGARGIHSYEVMDTCRPADEVETGDPDLSLFSYLDCLEQCFKDYSERVDGIDLMQTFDFLAFHTPFGGMVRGAHRKLVRKTTAAAADVIEADFVKRMHASLAYCTRVGNVYSASLYLALASLIDTAPLESTARVGMYSYGSGCSAEFFSGVVGPESKRALEQMKIGERIDARYRLEWDEYERLTAESRHFGFGVKDAEVDFSRFAPMYERALAGRSLLALSAIRNYRREYVWS
jgi:polyketide biosynthesis 3-hydroxy-3-methylglutaryl-CoA synthase-like enzyme PksG